MTRSYLSEIPRIKEEVESLMLDSCKIIPDGGTADAYNFRTPGGTAGAEIACAYRDGVSKEDHIPELIRSRATSVVLFPIGTTIVKTSMVRITKVKGTAVNLGDFRVVGDPQRVNTCILAYLERVAV
jgi:hypothetical protein